jgi:hypothetical protein
MNLRTKLFLIVGGMALMALGESVSPHEACGPFPDWPTSPMCFPNRSDNVAGTFGFAAVDGDDLLMELPQGGLLDLRVQLRQIGNPVLQAAFGDLVVAGNGGARGTDRRASSLPCRNAKRVTESQAFGAASCPICKPWTTRVAGSCRAV